MDRTASISAVVITRNEEAHIGPCLDGLAWCDEVVVVDSFSTDRTVEIARGRSARVLLKTWPGMPGPQRNEGLAAASGDWAFAIDADERVPDELRDEILEFARDPGPFAGASIPRKNVFFGKWLRHGGCYPDAQLRVFRRDACRYNEEPGRGFDTPIVRGETTRLGAALLHLTGETISDRIRKTDADAEIQARELVGSRARVGIIQLAFHPFGAFLKTYVTRAGYRDGVEGFQYAVLCAIHNFLKYAKLREMQIERTRCGSQLARP